jgi:hypothetical protein
MAVFCEAPTLACNVDDARAVAPVGSEHERERELDKYDALMTATRLRLHDLYPPAA